MKIKVKITRSEYLKLLFTLAYRRPATIVAAIFKFLVLLYIIVVFSEYGENSLMPSYVLFLSIFLVISTPLRLYFLGRKIYKGSRPLNEEIEYEMNEEKIVAKGATFAGERNWGKPYRVVELRDWFAIYDSKIMFNPIPKSSMTMEQQTELRDLLMKLETVKPSRFK